MNKTVNLIFLSVFYLSGCYYSSSIRQASEPARCKESSDLTWCRGVASWYGKEFQGRKTSNGDIYDMYGLSAAHRTLPLGTVIEVVSMETSKSVVVKVNDRGPFVTGRILDLSYGAASSLGMVQKGTAEVKFRVVHTPVLDDQAYYSIQAGAFSVRENAQQFKIRLENQFNLPVRVIPFDSPAGWIWRVRLGRFQNEAEAERSAERISKEDGVTPFILREDQGP